MGPWDTPLHPQRPQRLGWLKLSYQPNSRFNPSPLAKSVPGLSFPCCFPSEDSMTHRLPLPQGGVEPLWGVRGCPLCFSPVSHLAHVRQRLLASVYRGGK